jgi:predicted transcriptional regulator of viral defense system
MYMPRSTRKDLPRNRPFPVAAALASGMSRRELQGSLKSGKLERIARGWYRVPQGDSSEDQVLESAALRVGKPSAVCLISALVYYDLSDAVPRKTWLMVPAEKRTKYRDIRLFRRRHPAWGVGIEKRGAFQITSLERTLVDALTHRSILGSQVGIEALRRAVERKRTTLSAVMDMAVQLGADHRMRPYVEVLS